MKKQIFSFSNNVLLIWVAINLIMAPLAFALDEENYIIKSDTGKKNIIAGTFGQITPFSFITDQSTNYVNNLESTAKAADDITTNNAHNLKLDYFFLLLFIILFYLFSFYALNLQAEKIIFLFSIAMLIFISGCDNTIDAKVNMEITAPEDLDNIELIDGVPFEVSLHIACQGEDCSWNPDDCYDGWIDVTLPSSWDIEYIDFEGGVSTPPSGDADRTIHRFTKQYCGSFSEENPKFNITPSGSSLDTKDIKFSLNSSINSALKEEGAKGSVNFPAAKSMAATVANNDPDSNEALCNAIPGHYIDPIGCCGDDKYECGTISAIDNKFFCNIDPSYPSFYWYDYKHSVNIGTIGRSECPNSTYYDVVSGGQKGLFMCDGTPPIINISTSVCVVSLSDRINAHMEKCGLGKYNWSLLCQPPNRYSLECEISDSDCSMLEGNKVEIFRLSRQDNAHAALSYASYGAIIPGGGPQLDGGYSVHGLIPSGMEGGYIYTGELRTPGRPNDPTPTLDQGYPSRICCEAKNLNDPSVNILKSGTGAYKKYLLSLSSSTNAHAAYRYAYEPYTFAVAFSSDDANITNFTCNLASNNGILTASNGLIRLSSLNGLIAAPTYGGVYHEYLCDDEYGANHVYECCADRSCISPRSAGLLAEVDIDNYPFYCLSDNKWSHFCRNDPWNNPDYPRTDYDYCRFEGSIYGNGAYDGIFCSYTGEWLPTNENRTQATTIPWNDPSLQQTECCTPEQCWNGTGCYPEQNRDPLDPPFPGRDSVNLIDGQRCIDGNWSLSLVKYTWDKRNKGYCPYNSQCLVKPEEKENFDNGNLSDLNHLNYDDWKDNEIQCINDGQFIGDHYCENGTWTSRTKLVAQKLLNYSRSSTDFTLFCDNYNESLNYGSESQDFARDNPKSNNPLSRLINNICVLRLNPGSDQEKVLLGVALNKPIAEEFRTRFTFLNIVSTGAAITDCSGATGVNYERCSLANVWYNNYTMSVIFSKGAISNLEVRPALDRWIGLWNTIIEYLLGREQVQYGTFLDGELESYSFAYAQDFKRIYMDRKDNKEIDGVIERVAKNPGNPSSEFTTYLAVEYRNFISGICDTVNEYTFIKIVPIIGSTETMPISCNKTTAGGVTTEHVQTQTRYPSTSWTNDGLTAEQKLLWKELTAKLRVKKT